MAILGNKMAARRMVALVWAVDGWRWELLALAAAPPPRLAAAITLSAACVSSQTDLSWYIER